MYTNDYFSAHPRQPLLLPHQKIQPMLHDFLVLNLRCYRYQISNYGNYLKMIYYPFSALLLRNYFYNSTSPATDLHQHHQKNRQNATPLQPSIDSKPIWQQFTAT